MASKKFTKSFARQSFLFAVLFYVGFAIYTIARKGSDFHAAGRNFFFAARTDTINSSGNPFESGINVVSGTPLSVAQIDQNFLIITVGRHIANIGHPILSQRLRFRISMGCFVEELLAHLQESLPSLGNLFGSHVWVYILPA